MPSWTHLIRFVAAEDEQTYLGQLVDTTKDAGLDVLEGRPVKAYRINGDIYNGHVTRHELAVKKVRP